MALEISELKQYTDRQQSTVNELVDQVDNIASESSQSNQSIPGRINTSDSGPSTDSLELSTAQALISSLKTSLADAEKNRFQPRGRDSEQGRRRYHSEQGGIGGE